MPRTPLLRAFRKLFEDAHIARRSGIAMSDIPELRASAKLELSRRAEQPESAEPLMISRRRILTAAGVGAGAGAVAFGAPRVAAAKGQPTIAIVGAGIAGLSCALKLADHGYASTVYEASGRIGGRMFSNTNYWDQGQVSEWCGELIDTGHVTVQALAKRFRLPLDNLHKAEPAGSEDTYKFFGKYYLQSKATSDFLGKVASRVAFEATDYPTTFDSSTPLTAKLDNTSVYDWIETRVPGGHKSPFGQLLDAAYNIEYGSDTTDQSSLNLVYLLGYQPDTTGLSIFGASDETYHIRGGNQRLPTAMAASLGNVQTGYALQKLSKTSAGRYELVFDRGTAAASATVTADYVLLALPFAVLSGLDTSKAGFDTLKKEAIKDLGRGHNGKTQLQFSSRLWNKKGAWHGISNGSSYSDTGYQAGWDVTRAQPGTAGIMVFYSGGSVTDAFTATQPYSTIAGDGVQADATTSLQRAEAVFPGLTAAWGGKATQSLPHKSPLIKCAYSYWRVGQYTSFGGYEGVAQGRVLFAGEHTSQDFQGFMEGGASEGQRAGNDIIAAIRG
jgi:monoamine oxidase